MTAGGLTDALKPPLGKVVAPSADWLASLESDVKAATAHMRSAMATVQTQRAAAAAAVQRQLQRLDQAAAARYRPLDVSDRLPRILAAVRRRDFDSLTPRDQRLAVTRFEDLAGADMAALLAARPANWSRYVDACFRHWDRLLASPYWEDHRTLLARAPRTFAHLFVTGRPQDVAHEEGPARVAQLIRAAEPEEALQWLTTAGLDASWGYTAVALACWLWGRPARTRKFEAMWKYVRDDVRAESMLLPARKDGRTSWFDDQVMRPARVSGSVIARGLFVSDLLRAAASKAPDVSAWGEFVDKVLQSEWGDPRVPPPSDGWRRVEVSDPDSYRRFLSELVADDLKLFFQWAMSAADRESFWLLYLGSVRRSICLLDGDTHGRLMRQFHGADKRLSASINRAQRFLRQTTSAQAFCLYFDRHVIVEFSGEPNAAYIYERDFFEQLQRMIDWRQCKDPTDLKNKSMCVARIVHRPGWESRTEDKLADLGIHPD